MTARVLGIGTALPSTRLRQEQVAEMLASQPGMDRRAQRLVSAAFAAADIQTRYTVLPEMGGGEGGLHVLEQGLLLSPGTAQRNEEFRRSAPPLFAAASRQALLAAQTPAAAVTHVVTVSCTGLMAPGPDYALVRDLGLPSSVQRDHVGFVGCAAAIPALRLAARITVAEPDAVVLVAAAELCSLHVRSSADPEQIVAASLFADGAGAAVVSADASRVAGRHLELDGFATRLSDFGERDMRWTVGDEGFEMTLTSAVPRIIGGEAAAVVDEVFGGSDAVDAWAVHPGGRAILDRIESALALDATAFEPSRRVLREHGNMSSATVLFVLAAMLADTDRPDGQRVAALAFGPGLTVEAARLVLRDRVPATAPVRPSPVALVR